MVLKPGGMYMRCLPVRHLGHDFAGAFHIAREISPTLLDEDLLRVQDIVRGIALYRGVRAVGPGVQAARWTAQRYRVHALLLQWVELEPIELLARWVGSTLAVRIISTA